MDQAILANQCMLESLYDDLCKGIDWEAQFEKFY